MGLFNDDIKKQLKEILENVKNDVHLLYFTQEMECHTCSETRSFLEEICELSEKLHLDVKDFVADSKEAKKHGVDKIPAIVVMDQDKNDYGIKFYGIPAGYEINSFLDALKIVSGAADDLPPEVLEKVKSIDKDIHIQVFVTPTCPYCPGPVMTGHRLALENPHIKADMVEATTFPVESQKYGVHGVPKIVINETHDFVGGHPMSKFLEVIDSI